MLPLQAPGQGSWKGRALLQVWLLPLARCPQKSIGIQMFSWCLNFPAAPQSLDLSNTLHKMCYRKCVASTRNIFDVAPSGEVKDTENDWHETGCGTESPLPTPRCVWTRRFSRRDNLRKSGHLEQRQTWGASLLPADIIFIFQFPVWDTIIAVPGRRPH